MFQSCSESDTLPLAVFNICLALAASMYYYESNSNNASSKAWMTPVIRMVWELMELIESSKVLLLAS